MLKRVGGVVVCAILGCLVGVILRNPFVYMAFFGVLVGCFLFALLMLIMQLMGRILPQNFEQAYRRKTNRLTVIIFSAVLLYFFGQPCINAIVLSDATGVISLLSKIATIVFFIFFGWCLLGPRRKRITVSGIVVFVLFTALLSFVSPGDSESSEVAGVDLLGNLSSLGYVDWVATEDVEKSLEIK